MARFKPLRSRASRYTDGLTDVKWNGHLLFMLSPASIFLSFTSIHFSSTSFSPCDGGKAESVRASEVDM